MARLTELVEKAQELRIDTVAFKELAKQFGEAVAIKALQTVIKEKERALEEIDHVEVFYDEHGSELGVLFDSLATLRVLLNGYNAKHSAKLALNLDADSADDLLYEKKRGPRSTISRDIPAFAQKLKASAVYSNKLRLKDARDGDYHSATLQPDGKVKNGSNQPHDTLNDWASYVYDQAVQAGKRETNTCNVWVSVEIAKKDGGWVRLGEAYEEVMGG